MVLPDAAWAARADSTSSESATPLTQARARDGKRDAERALRTGEEHRSRSKGPRAPAPTPTLPEVDPLGDAGWWTLRRAQSLKPVTYRCPLCDELLHAMSEHVLIAPEGDADRRRHAHTACVAEARRSGRLPTHDEVAAREPPARHVLARLRAALRG
jgi:hypothetical protein